MTSVFVDWSDEDDSAARAIADRLAPQRDQFIGDLYDATLKEVPELAATDTQRTFLYASIAENVLVLMNALASPRDDPSTATPPPGAIALARELARRDISLSLLLRAYRIGQAKFTALCLDLADPGDIGALRAVIAKVAAFIDHISEAVTRKYEVERERQIAVRSGLTQHLIQQILEGGDAEARVAAQELGYDLAATHLAIDIASLRPATAGDGADEVGETYRRIRALAGSAVGISAPTGRSSVCLWLPDTEAAPLVAEIRRVLAELRLPVQVAVGSPRSGPAGFRQTYHQAERVRALCSTAVPEPPALVTFDDIAPVAMLIDDPDTLRAFVHRTLGSLAEPSVRAAELRETLRVYLRTHRSPAATAERMILHRNTIRYRIQQVTAGYPELLDGADPYLVMSALEVCRWYGRLVLADQAVSRKSFSGP